MVARWLLGAALTLLLLAVGGGALLVVSLFRPEVLNRDLAREFSTLGITLGEATGEEVRARFGQPARERQESLSTLYEYPELGLSLRVGRESNLLEWYAFSSPHFASGRGIRVGAHYGEVQAAYGQPSDVTPLSDGVRVRYAYGAAYVLEFWLNPEWRVDRVVFFRA